MHRRSNSRDGHGINCSCWAELCKRSPIFVAEYQLVKDLPKDLEANLPSVEQIESQDAVQVYTEARTGLGVQLSLPWGVPEGADINGNGIERWNALFTAATERAGEDPMLFSTTENLDGAIGRVNEP